MEWALATFGGKFCCIFASTCGGAANVLTKRTWGWGAVKDIGLSIVVGWIAAEFLIRRLWLTGSLAPKSQLDWHFSLAIAAYVCFQN